MKYEVYHAFNPTFSDSKPCQFPSEFEKVAEVECENLGCLYKLTNHINSDWTTNPEVKWRKGSGRNTRSTSVGDVVVDSNGNALMCMSVGWKKI